jgi:signal recognition particle receptor subunit beta
VVVANKQNHPDAWTAQDLRIVLGLQPNVKVIPAVTTNKTSTKRVLDELFYSVLETYDTN